MLLACLVITPSFVHGQGDRPGKRVDDIFQEWNKPGAPGAAVAVVQTGQVVFAKGYGLANLEYDIPVRAESVYHVASVSKQFTAMALVLLEQDGKLSLDDDVHQYLPELPPYAAGKVTIRELLQHTSGIRDQWQTLAVAGWRLDDVITQRQILRLLFRQKELNFTPATRHLYSNGGYTLAAEIVARVVGKPFPDFCAERIFRPLGMTRTHFHDDHRRIVHDRGYSYEKTAEGYQASPLNYANVGATSLFTTAPDLVRWLDNFRDPKVGGSAAIARLQERAILTDGKKIDYGLGVALGKHRGLKTVLHGGGDAGYRSFVLWFPEQELGVAVVSGLASFNSGAVAHKVADVFLGEKIVAEDPKPAGSAAPPTFVTLESKVLDQYTGRYWLEAGVVAEVRNQEGRLMAIVPGQSPEELKPISTNRFYVAAAKGEVVFTRQDDRVRLRFAQGEEVVHGERITVSEAPYLADYQGVYWSEELQTEYSMVLKSGKLIANHIRHGEIALTPVAKDRFVSAEWFMPEVIFRRDSSDRIVGVTFGGGRVSGLGFERR